MRAKLILGSLVLMLSSVNLSANVSIEKDSKSYNEEYKKVEAEAKKIVENIRCAIAGGATDEHIKYYIKENLCQGRTILRRHEKIAWLIVGIIVCCGVVVTAKLIKYLYERYIKQEQSGALPKEQPISKVTGIDFSAQFPESSEPGRRVRRVVRT
jgi:5-bromo-4-chloroindolyl phosphate hydrolysis protein